MWLAKLNTGQIVRVLRYNVTVAFNNRRDNVLVMFMTRFKEMKWVNTTNIVWHHDFFASNEAHRSP